MRSNYKKIGQFIQQVNIKNNDLAVDNLLGVSITKKFIPSIANIIGTDMTTYKIIKKGQFAYGPVTSRNGDKISVALLEDDEAIVSTSYTAFEIINTDKLLAEYLMMWFRREEFDRYARYMSHGSTREAFGWEEMCEIELPVPSIKKQKELVKEYHTITDRIKLNEQLNQKLEDTAQSIYKEWFVNFEFPDENGKPYKSNGGEMVYCEELEMEIPVGWSSISIKNISNLKYGKMLDSSKFLEKGYPIFSGYGIRGYYSSYMYEESQILVLCRGVSGTGEVKLSPPKAYITNLSIVVEINHSEMDKYFVYYYLKNQNLRQLDSGSAQSQITIEDLNRVIVLQPPEKLQKKFNNYIKTIELNLENKNKNNEYLETFKTILLSKIATIEG
ncbi:MAG: restriction endonuclease subunit S [Thiovulaceae bacterium]|nr:restriction endonuclease subunit S [Sulfurimonadaceae bacterium]